MRFISWGATALFVLALMLGGGSQLGIFSDFIPEVFSIVLLVLIVLNWQEKSSAFGLPLVLLIAILCIGAVQLLPVPIRIWSVLPQRSDIMSNLNALQIHDIDMRISLRPGETMRSIFTLFPAIALYLAAPFLSLHRRVKLVLVLAVIVAISIIIAFLQILGGASSGLYFYTATTLGRAVGFFANPNHFTALLYASLPLVLAVFAERSEHILSRPFVVMGAVTFIWLVGLSISGSRSALILGALSLALSFFLFVRHAMPEFVTKKNLFLSALLIGLVLLPVLLGVGLSFILHRFDAQDMLEDARGKILPVTLGLIWRYLPFGSGFGSFSAIYAAQEPAHAAVSDIVNHAHNDILELAVEGGLPVIILIGIWLVYFGSQIRAHIFQHNHLEGRLAKASLISILLLMLHSAWDYPLRTIALSSLFAVAHGFLLPARHHHAHGPHLLDDAASTLSVWDIVPGRRRRRRPGGPRAREAE